MSAEVAMSPPLESPVLADKSKKKRKHTDDERNKSAKKKRKHAPDDAEVAQEETVTATPEKSHKKDKHKKKHNDGALISPETSPTKPGVQAEDMVSETPTKTSITPPASQARFEGKVSTLSENKTTTTAFYSKRASLLVPLPPIAISTTTALSSLLAQHISPLLLTYYPPLKGIVLSFSDPFLSTDEPTDAEAAAHASIRQAEGGAQPVTLAHSRDEHGVSFIWLTVTFIVFSPKPGDELEGYINVASDGFVGLVSYNYFQASIGKERIPQNWKWVAPSGLEESGKKKSIKSKIRDEDSETPKTSEEASQSDSDLNFDTAPEDQAEETTKPQVQESGYFTISPSTEKISGPLKYRIIDTELIPGHSADTWSLRILGTLLDEEEEQKLRETEQEKWEARERRRRNGQHSFPNTHSNGDRRAANFAVRERTRNTADEDVVMTGALEEASTPPPSSSSASKKKKKKH